jgi:hypothetical protein
MRDGLANHIEQERMAPGGESAFPAVLYGSMTISGSFSGAWRAVAL